MDEETTRLTEAIGKLGHGAECINFASAMLCVIGAICDQIPKEQKTAITRMMRGCADILDDIKNDEGEMSMN